MWLCLNNAFFSIVANKGDDRLVVRARRQGDIERVFGLGGVYSPGRDYAYRAFLERDVVASVVMCATLGIDYTNFKDSVRDPALHSAYNAVWGVMGRLQAGGPYGQGLRRNQKPSEHNYGPGEAARRIGYGRQKTLMGMDPQQEALQREFDEHLRRGGDRL